MRVTCGICNAEFDWSTKRRKFCSDQCRDDNDRLKSREYGRIRQANGYFVRYYNENSEKISVRISEWRKTSGYGKEYKRKNKLKYAEYESKRRSQKINDVNEDVSFEYIISRDKSICWLCDELVLIDDLEFDHAVPLSRKGKHTVDNIYCSHSWCNRRKHAKDISELEKIFPKVNKKILAKVSD